MDINEELNRQKGKRSWSQFARDIGLSRESLWHLRRGNFKPGSKTLKALGFEIRYVRTKVSA